MGEPDKGGTHSPRGAGREGISWHTENQEGKYEMKRRKKHTIVRHRGYWCLRFRERVRVGDEVQTVQRSKRLALIDPMHKTRKSVEHLADARSESVKKAPANYVADRLGDFAARIYLPHVQGKRKPSTVRGYRQIWERYLKRRCADVIMYSAETHTIQGVLDDIEREESLSPQTMANVKHLLSGMFKFAIKQNHVPKGTLNPVTFTETATIPDFDGRAYSLEEIALMLSVLPEPSRSVVATAAFTGLRAGEIRGLTWNCYRPGDGKLPSVLQVLQSVWRGHIGEPKNKRSKAPVPLIPQLEAILERHRAGHGNPSSGPIFANGVGKALDLDSLYNRQMKEPLKRAGIDWEGWHGFRRGLATNLERIGVRDAITAMILRHTNDRVTRKHYIKPPSIEAVAAMQRLSETLLTLEKPELLPTCSPDTSKTGATGANSQWVQ
jgi:integrase